MINCWNLRSGGSLVIEDIPYLKSAAVGVYIKVGSRNETGSLAGASHFMEHMLFKGTEKRTARDIAEGFEEMGGQLNAFTSKEYTCIYARTLDEDIYAAIDIVFDMLFNSQLSDKDLDTEREVVIEEINMYEDTPDELIHDIFAQKFWADHPMGSSILGTLDSITNMSRDELIKYYHRYYVPTNMIIAIAGNVDANRIKDTIEGITEKYQGPEPGFIQQSPGNYNSFISLLPKEIEQVQICVGFPGLSYFNEDRYTQNVMNSILGGGMSSRLFQRLREELGLAYSVYSYPSNYSDTGSFNIYIGTGPGKVARFQEALFEQIHDFTTNGVTSEEVARTQKLIKSSIYLGLESVMNRMTRLAKSLLMYKQIVPPDEVINKIYAVTPDMVQELAERTLKTELVSMAAIGDKGVLPLVEAEFTKWWRG